MLLLLVSIALLSIGLRVGVCNASKRSYNNAAWAELQNDPAADWSRFTNRDTGKGTAQKRAKATNLLYR